MKNTNNYQTVPEQTKEEVSFITEILLDETGQYLKEQEQEEKIMDSYFEDMKKVFPILKRKSVDTCSMFGLIFSICHSVDSNFDYSYSYLEIDIEERHSFADIFLTNNQNPFKNLKKIFTKKITTKRIRWSQDLLSLLRFLYPNWLSIRGKTRLKTHNKTRT